MGEESDRPTPALTMNAVGITPEAAFGAAVRLLPRQGSVHRRCVGDRGRGAACAMAGVITIVYGPDGGHNPAGAVELVKWMADRFDGRAPVNDC